MMIVQLERLERGFPLHLSLGLLHSPLKLSPNEFIPTCQRACLNSHENADTFQLFKFYPQISGR